MKDHERRVSRHSGAVRTLGRERVETVDDSQYSRANRDLFSAQAGRIAHAIPALVMAPDERRHRAGERHRAHDLRAHLRVDLHLPPLVRRERAGLGQDVLGNGQLADIVKQRRDLDRLRVQLRELELPRQRGGVVLDPLDVRAAVAVLGLNGAREHLGALQVELRPLRDTPPFFGDAAEIDPVGPVRQAERNERQGRLPVPRLVQHLDGNAGSNAPDHVARDAPQEVVVPHAEDAAARRQRECRRDRERVDEEISHRRRHQRRQRGSRQRAIGTAEPRVRRAGGGDRQRQRGHAEERLVRRIRRVHAERALEPRARHRDEHRRRRTEHQERREVDGVRQ